MILLFYITFLGAETLAARQYANNISTFTYLFAIAVGMGTSIIVGRLVGANEKDLAYTRVWSSVKWSISIMTIVVILIMIFRTSLMKLFTDNPEIIEIGSSVLLFSILLETGRSVNIVLVNSLRASGDAKYPLFIRVFSMVLMSVPLGYFLVFQLELGLVGMWIAISVDEWIRASFFYFRWRSRKWEKHLLVPEARPEEPLTVEG